MLGGVAQWGLHDECDLMDSHMVGVLSGTMVVPTAGLARAMRISSLKIDQWLMVMMASVASAQGMFPRVC